MTYLLDTDTCVAIIPGNPPRARARFERATARGDATAVSAVTAFKLGYGVAKSRGRDENLQAVEAFLAGPVELWPFEDNDAHAAGHIRAALEASGKPIGPYGLLIAGQGVSHGAVVVTANAAEFGRVTGLKLEDWAK